MNFDKLIHAELVWDGGDTVHIPTVMDPPLPDQMQGTTHDRLGELAARTCYDSLGVDQKTGKRRGRTTDKMHEHLLEVKNYNVYEHADFTVLIDAIPRETLMCCLINRPGVWCELTTTGFEVTMNHRCVLEWYRWKTSFGHVYEYTCDRLGGQLWNYARNLAPKIYPDPKYPTPTVCRLIPKTENLLETQASVSLYLSFSRGCGNEQCRHRFRMSQRSTRFCDESDSPYVQHPLITQFLNDEQLDEPFRNDVALMMFESERQDKAVYLQLVGHLQEYLRTKGVEGTQARKQARGAARGYLALALHTEMVFTAPVSAWKWILSQRGTKLADAEIRVLYAPQVLDCLKASRYGYFFEDIHLEDCPDGIGKSIV